MPFWEEAIVPELKSGKTVFVAAHGNSIRAILKFLEGISDNDITGRACWALAACPRGKTHVAALSVIADSKTI